MMQDNPQQTVLAYLAGIIDGEGTIRINRQTMPNRTTPFHAGCISVGMVLPDSLKLLQETFGGSLRIERAQKPNRRPVYRWAMTGRHGVKAALEQLLPYLLVKRKQAELVLELFERWVTPTRREFGVDPAEIRRREELYLEVRKLNAVGVAATTECIDPERGCDSLNPLETLGEKSEEVSPPTM